MDQCRHDDGLGRQRAPSLWQLHDGPIGGITDTGGTVYIDGTLTNTGATLNVGPGTADVVVLASDGTIVGGTIVDPGLRNEVPGRDAERRDL